MIPRHLRITALVLLIAVFAMTSYIVRLQHGQRRNLQMVSDPRPVGPPPSGRLEKAIMVIAFDEDGVLKAQGFDLHLPAEREQRMRELVRALLSEYVRKPSSHPLGPGANIRDAYLVNGSLAVLDMNVAFAEEHPSGIRVEQFTLYSIAETIRENFPEVTRIKVLVHGNERETLAGHIDLTPTYDIAQLHESARELE